MILNTMLGNKMTKTAELTGVALDWAVAKCEGVSDTWGKSSLIPYDYFTGHRYSTNWAQGGPIIEREISKVWQNMGGTYGAQIKYREPYYSPTYDADIGAVAFINAHGKTPLEAAMRCYVASKLGDEIDIPEELQNGDA